MFTLHVSESPDEDAASPCEGSRRRDKIFGLSVGGKIKWYVFVCGSSKGGGGGVVTEGSLTLSQADVSAAQQRRQ